jgi:hypothetical protein
VSLMRAVGQSGDRRQVQSETDRSEEGIRERDQSATCRKHSRVLWPQS